MSFFLKRRPKAQQPPQDEPPAKAANRFVDYSAAKREGAGEGGADGRDVLLGLSRRRQPRSPVRAPLRQQGRGRREPSPVEGAGAREPHLAAGRDKRQGSLAGQEPGSLSRNTRLVREKPVEQPAPAPVPPAKEEPAPEAAPRRRSGFFASLASLVRLWFLALFGVVLLALVLVAVYRGSLWIYDEVVTSEFFETRHIDITGNVRLTRDMILDIGGLREGMNSFAVSIADVEHNLRSTPWVEDVSVKRLLPDRFVIRIRERMPSFWVRREGRLFYANDRGEPIAPVEGENFLSLPVLSIEEGSEDAVPFLARLMKDMRSGILPIESGAIATVDVTPARGVEIYLEDREMRISLAPDDWEGNLARLAVAISDLARKRELGGVLEIRAMGGSVWVRNRQGTSQ